MFGWRRRSEGFEWREYVRTTILVRRADRQRRLDDARMAALAKVKHAADAGVDAGRAGVSFAGNQFAKLLSLIGAALLDFAVAMFHLVVRWSKFLFAVISDAVGGAAAPFAEAAQAPLRAAREKVRHMPDVARRLPIKPRHLMMGAGALAAIYFGGPILRGGEGNAVVTVEPDAASPVTTSSLGSGSSDISGRAFAVAGDLLRVGGTLVRLDGVEAPAAGQTCSRSNGRRWSCASAARAGLDRLVRGRTVACTASGQDDAGHTTGRCVVDGSLDVATELVRSGQVFAASSMFNSLSSEEDAARNAKSGIWQSDDVVRPQEWRDRAWEDAKRDAPDGCPIKGLVRSKVYALPGSADYARTKVRTERGDRWFCSEDEAKAAGFAPSSRS